MTSPRDGPSGTGLHAGIIYETVRRLMREVGGVTLHSDVGKGASLEGPWIRLDVVGKVNGCMDFRFDSHLAEHLARCWVAKMGGAAGAVDTRLVLEELGNMLLGHIDGKFEDLGLEGTISPPREVSEPPGRETWREVPTSLTLSAPEGTVGITLYYLREGRGEKSMETNRAARILIVDDSPIIRNVLRGILERHGLEVVGEAGDGIEAIRQFKELRPDAVTLDIIMPLMGGVEALRAIKAIDPSARAVMISAMTSRKKALEAAEHGAANYIIKPFEEEKVIATIRKVLTDQP